MLMIAKSLRELSFDGLMGIYAEGNLENARELWPDEPEPRQIALAEQEFYNYLQQSFFRTPGAVYAVWQAQGRYVSALRLESYQDGLLLEALETAPGERRKGYAKALIHGVTQYLQQHGSVKVYSHVHKRNMPSLAAHKACGFQVILDHAVYADGSVMPNSYTLCKII